MLSLDMWLVPLYAGRRDHWALGIIRLPQAGQPLTFQYIDSDPVVSEAMEAQGSSWAFRVSYPRTLVVPVTNGTGLS